MPILVQDARFSAHGLHCRKCREADFPKQLCRNGRRLFIRFVGGMDEDQRAVFLLGLPEDIRNEVIKRFPTEMEGFQVFDFPPKTEN